MPSWTQEEIGEYLAAIGQAPTPDGRITGPSPFCRQRGHQATMDLRNGQWTCPSCCSGDLEGYEVRRSGIFLTCPERKANQAIREIIREAKEKALERAWQTERFIASLALPTPVAGLLRKVYRTPGRSHRYLQQVSHLRRGKFQSTIRDLERRGLISYQDTPSTAGRNRRVYFPASIGEPSGMPHTVSG